MSAAVGEYVEWMKPRAAYRLSKIERLVGQPWSDHRMMLTLYLACIADQVGAQ